jgi:hypothetical protein
MNGIQTNIYTFRLRAARLAQLLCLVFLTLLIAACPGNDKRPNVSGPERPAEANSPGAGATAFDGQRAMDHVRKQIEFGPRIPGSEQLAKTREYILDTLKSSGLNVRTDVHTDRR